MRVKSFLATLLLMVAGLQTTWAQGFRVYKTDGTVVQFSLRTDSIVFYDDIGSDVDFGPYTPVNQMIVGTWYKSKKESVTFNEDSSTDYMEGFTYEFMPYQGSVIFYNTDGAPVNVYVVHKVTKESLIMSQFGDSGNISVWTRTQPVQLVTSIVLSETSLKLKPDETKTLTATVLPEDADNKAVTWESSNEEVAEVNKNGRVIANGIGNCVITCRATDGSGVKAECTVTVADIQLVTGITLSQTSLSLTLPTNTSQTLTATIQPTDATNKNVTWSSSNTSVATVDQTGKVTAKAAGSCIITATAADGSGVKAECAVTVIQLVTGITLSESSLTLFPNGTQTLTATIQPANANNKQITWSSSDTSIATVDQEGKVTGVALGSCAITATAKDGSGVKGTCAVIVDHEWVDLDLPSGTLWATCNVGASSLVENGDYFAWGETTGYNDGKIDFSWSTYKYCNGSKETLTKYCTQSNYGYNTFTDNLTELLPEDDAATVNWGNNWQIPSEEQYNELINSSYTTSEWMTVNGKYDGMMITSKSNGKSVFLPSAGFRYNTGVYLGSGHYSSRSLDTHSYYGSPFNRYLDFTSGNNHTSAAHRFEGGSIRPVRKQ